MNLTSQSPSSEPPTPEDSPVSRRLGTIVVLSALLLATATIVVFSGVTPLVPTASLTFVVYGADGLLTLLLLVLIFIETRKVLSARRAGRAAARLHSRVVLTFAMVAAAPALVTALLATVSLERVLNPRFFSEIGAFVEEAAGLQRDSQCRDLLGAAEILAADLSLNLKSFGIDQQAPREFMTSRAKMLGFNAAAMISEDGGVGSASEETDFNLIAKPSAADFAAARQGQSVCAIVDPHGEGSSLALVALRPITGLEGSFIYAARRLDANTEKFASDSAAIAAKFARYEHSKNEFEFFLAIIFMLLATTMVLSAIWLGFSFANRMVGPIRRLIRAADAIAAGDLNVEVTTRRADGDLGRLGATFNKMTSELRAQQGRLLAANATIEERRAFTEAVLSGVPAGVLGVDRDGVVTASNVAAEKMFGDTTGEAAALLGKRIEKILPALDSTFLTMGKAGRPRLQQSQTKSTIDGRERTLNVRVASDPRGPEQGYVVTFDDISELVAAQRTAAWAEVARRIAHEIKNPLTPIQLSAERLKRRYGRTIIEGKDIFDQCTDTIIRQVDDIKRMVDEFSSFARMPKSKPITDDLTDCVRQSLFLMKIGRPDLAIEEVIPDTRVRADFDRRLLAQAITNVVKNAGEGIDALGRTTTPKGRIRVTLSTEEKFAVIHVADDGKGFPRRDRHLLIEPYVTTRAEGTGLGLPIVIKIFEDHQGRVELLDGLQREDGEFGAMVVMWLPLHSESAPTHLEAGAAR